VDFSAFKSKPTRHNQTYVSRTQNNHVSANHHVLQVNEVLGDARSEHASGSSSRNANLSTGSFTTPHSKNHGFGVEANQPFGTSNEYFFVRRNLKHHTTKHACDAQPVYFIDVPLSVLWTRQLFLEEFNAETVMYALRQDAAEPLVPFYDHQVLNAVLLCADGGGEPCWTSTNHNQINISTRQVSHFFCSPSNL